MWKIPVLGRQGVSTGLLKLARREYDEHGEETLTWLHHRCWEGKPRPQHFETLLQCKHGDGFAYYLLIGYGRELTEDDYARELTPSGAAEWLLAEGYDFPEELQAIGRRGNSKATLTPVTPAPLSPAQQEVWDLLARQALTAKELAREVAGAPVSEDSIRKRIAGICKTGREIKNQRGHGYYRPDAPPTGWTGAQRESG